ncbi:hypothetical protein TSAR_004015 [Trichomalopsis sarcophagae]|uniref:Uncharacterized protein n=1 Tax=Trichomalopsis sarcophagae TaxID=543379 RepID=A0A232EXL5_9HYME|nr:hypothetical protein TSAR_004015 [Trichomalopsis sarcophagae]
MPDTDSLMETVSEYEEQFFQVDQAKGEESDKIDSLSYLTKVEADDSLSLDYDDCQRRMRRKISRVGSALRDWWPRFAVLAHLEDV